MSGLSAFLKHNAVQEENVFYPASRRFLDEDGKPMQWEIKSITSIQDEDLRRTCTTTVQVPGKKNQFTQDFDTAKYAAMLAAACTVSPNLNSQELQDSYGVMGAEAVLKAMLKPGEFNEYAMKVQEVNGFNSSMDELVNEAKN